MSTNINLIYYGTEGIRRVQGIVYVIGGANRTTRTGTLRQ
jgi:hypothetical protein